MLASEKQVKSYSQSCIQFSGPVLVLLISSGIWSINSATTTTTNATTTMWLTLVFKQFFVTDTALKLEKAIFCHQLTLFVPNHRQVLHSW